MDFIPFLIRAKRATYAGNGPKAAPSRPASNDLHYTEGNLQYIDTYLGGQDFIGEEAVWQDGKPLWGMNYYGRTATFPEGFSAFLKAALSEPPAEAPYRGPALFEQGDYRYECRWEGTLEQFHGDESIHYKGEQVYWCRFHGGVIR
jgi:hypothetical protein